MNLDSFTGPGSTPSRRRFWDKVTAAVIASQKVAGDNVSVDEHQGAGTVINVDRKAGAMDGACCDGAETITVTFDGILFCPDGNPYSGDLNGTFVLTKLDDTHWQGDGATITFSGTPITVTIDLVCGGEPPFVFVLTITDVVGFTHFIYTNDTESPTPGTILDNGQTFDQCGITTLAYGGTGTYSC